MHPLIETWQVHNRINTYLLNGIEDDEYLNDKAASKGRSVGEQFAHIHNVRLMWLKEAAPALMDGLEKIEKEHAHSSDALLNGLEASGKAIEKLLEQGIAENRIKGFKPHPTAFLGYLIAHESHHRGQIMICLKENGHAVSKKVGFGMWEWGVR